MPRSENTVVLVRFSAFGDVAMTVPAVYSACRCYPDVRFVMVTRPAMTSMFVNAPANLTVVGYDLKGEYAGLSGIRRMVSDMCVRFKPSAMVDLHDVLRTRIMGILLRLNGVAVSRIHKPRAARRRITRERGKDLTPAPTQRELFRRAFAEAGYPVEECFDGLFAGRDSAPAELYAAITTPKGVGEQWVGIAPFAAHPGKVYPPEKMEEVVKLLCDKLPDSRIFLFGGGGEEQAVLERWAEKYPCCTSLAGKRYGFQAELALMNHLDVMVSMDSANMHLAAIAGTRVVSLWGATHPACGFTPWRAVEDDFVQTDLPCRPCSVFGNKPCRRGDLECFNAISPERVVGAILKTL